MTTNKKQESADCQSAVVHRPIMHTPTRASCTRMPVSMMSRPATIELGPHVLDARACVRVPANVCVVWGGVYSVERTLGTGAERNTLDRFWNHCSQYGHVLSRSVRHVTLRVHNAVRLGSAPRTTPS